MDADESTDHLKSASVQISTWDNLIENRNRQEVAVTNPFEDLRSQCKTPEPFRS